MIKILSEEGIQRMRDLIIRINGRKKGNLNQTSSRELDDYYDRKLKKFDTE